eukprot:m.21941 g.21941  ORF g.21941 m.21941 type:complete len:108 (+) comp28246_c0_seq3:1-324(+)
METAKKRQAKVNGFVEARFAEGLNSEVLQNGKDLWLVQVPQNLDLSSLNGVQLKMKECKNEFCLKSENGESKEFRFQSLRVRLGIPCNSSQADVSVSRPVDSLWCQM